MPAYLVARFTVKNSGILGAYSKAAAPIIASFGGELLFKCDTAETLTGESQYSGIAVFRFPDKNTLNDFYHSDAYQALTDKRREGADMILSNHFTA